MHVFILTKFSPEFLLALYLAGIVHFLLQISVLFYIWVIISEAATGGVL